MDEAEPTGPKVKAKWWSRPRPDAPGAEADAVDRAPEGSEGQSGQGPDEASGSAQPQPERASAPDGTEPPAQAQLLDPSGSSASGRPVRDAQPVQDAQPTQELPPVQDVPRPMRDEPADYPVQPARSTRPVVPVQDAQPTQELPPVQ
ncbi:hypothetical protein P8605_49005, partial [Streptomyces sp. T-3]|nr:hypothetical protein [Streptomyces sp. T-3]